VRTCVLDPRRFRSVRRSTEQGPCHSRAARVDDPWRVNSLDIQRLQAFPPSGRHSGEERSSHEGISEGDLFLCESGHFV